MNAQRDGASPPSVREELDDYVARYLLESLHSPATPDDGRARAESRADLDPRLASLADAGILECFPDRREALRRFIPILERARRVVIVGSSLKGLIHPEGSDLETREVVRQRVRRQLDSDEGVVLTDFVLTHPGLADLRAQQESRERLEIGHEVIRALVDLKEWDVPASSVHLYLGTPTCFGIQADDRMLLNPYPYADVAFESPCLLLSDEGYFFRVFAKSHFGILDRTTMVRLSDLSVDIGDLYMNMDRFQERTDELLRAARESTSRHSSDAESALERLPGFLEILASARKRRGQDVQTDPDSSGMG